MINKDEIVVDASLYGFSMGLGNMKGLAMQSNLKELDPVMYETNCIMAQKISESEHCVQHVGAQFWRGEFQGYYVSDWMDEATITSFENGVELG